MHFQVCVQWCDRWTSNNGQTKQPQPSPFPNGVYNTKRHQQTPTDTSRHQVQIQTAFVNIYTYKNVFVENSNADVALQLFQKNIFVYVFTT
jgi:hypothetical protein